MGVCNGTAPPRTPQKKPGDRNTPKPRRQQWMELALAAKGTLPVTRPRAPSHARRPAPLPCGSSAGRGSAPAHPTELPLGQVPPPAPTFLLNSAQFFTIKRAGFFQLPKEANPLLCNCTCFKGLVDFHQLVCTMRLFLLPVGICHFLMYYTT